MSVSEPFIRRPIATSLLGIALMIGGALGYWALPVSALPQVDFPTVQVSTQLPGASPDVVASLITAPLERQLGQIPSLSSMNSTSSFGVSQISLQFDLNRDIDGATQDVQAAINAAAGILPKSLPYPPVYAKVNPADAPVMTLALTSDTISLRAMSDLADTILGQRLSQISGVGRVSILGGLKPAVRVQADLARLAAYGIAMEDLRNAIAGANVSGPKGSLDGAQQSYTIAANDQIAANRSYFGDFDPFGDYDLLFGATRLNLKIIEVPIRYRERTYGATNIDRWRHGWLLLQMVDFAARRIKFI